MAYLPASDSRLAAAVAEEAGRLLLKIRRSSGLEGRPLGDEGDRSANELILSRLAEARPDDAVLSEEAADDPARLAADRVWIVDPLDGTREFALPGRNDWAVHVALWERGRGITAAAVAQPALAEVWCSDRVNVIRAYSKLMLVSDSRPPAFATGVAEAVGVSVAPMGSAGAKAMAVVRGLAGAYLHAGGQWEWDSAAPVGVVLAGGLHASRIDGSELVYNQEKPYVEDLLICRPELAEPLLAAIAELA